MSAYRREHLVELGVVELADLVLAMDRELEMLRRVLAGSMCGDVHEGRSCQLVRGHTGGHVWMLPDESVIHRW